jgi:hypothetical protein
MDHPPKLQEMVLYAWVGPDDALTERTDEFGIKQGYAPCGLIPLVACKEGKIDHGDILNQMSQLTNQTGKPRYLAKFVFQEVVKIVEPKRSP